MESIASFFGRLPEGEAKWCEGVLAADGALYCPPRNQRTVLRVDVARKTCTTFCRKVVPQGFYKYSAGVLADDGCIYCVPAQARTVLCINPASCKLWTFGAVGSTCDKSRGLWRGVRAKDVGVICYFQEKGLPLPRCRCESVSSYMYADPDVVESERRRVLHADGRPLHHMTLRVLRKPIQQ